jgi:hypothetical protein
MVDGFKLLARLKTLVGEGPTRNGREALLRKSESPE